MTTLKFNGKLFDYDKLVKTPSRGVHTEIDVNEANIKHTLASLKTNGERHSENCIIAYHFKGSPVILVGLELYRQAVANKDKKIKVWLFNKHSMNAFMLISDTQCAITDVGRARITDPINAAVFARPNPFGGYNPYREHRGEPKVIKSAEPRSKKY